MEEKKSAAGSSSRISWHPAFVEALQMELQEYRDDLEFLPEWPLTSEPLQIDCIVIKRAKDTVIKKNIAEIFRGWRVGIGDRGSGIVVCYLCVLATRFAF